MNNSLSVGLSSRLNGDYLAQFTDTRASIRFSLNGVEGFKTKLSMRKVILIGLLLVASSTAFELPIVFDIGSFFADTPMLDHQVKAAGPFVTPRNVTLNFEWDTIEQTIWGVRIRGSEPRYDRVSVTLHRLDRTRYNIDVTVINTSFCLFWAEAHGQNDELVPERAAEKEPEIN